MREKNLPVLFLNLLRSKKKKGGCCTMQKRCYCLCQHFVVNFTMLNFMGLVLHFTVGVTRLLLSSGISLLVISERGREKSGKV